MLCSRDTYIQLRANLLAKGYTEEQVNKTLQLIIEKGKNESFKNQVEGKTVEVLTEDDKVFLKSSYETLQTRIKSIADESQPLNKSFRELVSSLLTADDRVRLFKILNKIKISNGDFSSLDTSYLNNLENIIQISRAKGRVEQVAKLEERLQKEQERLSKQREKEKASQSNRDKLREEIENIQQLLVFISSILDGSISSESIDVVNTLVKFNQDISETKLAIAIKEAELKVTKESLKKSKVTGTEKNKNELKSKISSIEAEIKKLKKKVSDLDKQRTAYVKEQIKKGLLTSKEELQEYESLGSLKIQLAKKVDSLKEKLAKETLSTYQQSAKQISKSLEEKLVRERTAATSIKNVHQQRLRILDAYTQQREDAFPDEPVLVDLGFLMHLVGTNAVEKFIQEKRQIKNKDGSISYNRSDFRKDEAVELINNARSNAYNALSQGFYSDDLAVVTEEQLAYLEALALGKEVVDVFETNVNNIPVAPNNPNFLEKSNPGVVPVENKAKTAKQLATWLEFTLRGLHSLKASKYNNGYISSVALDMVLHPRLYDMVTTIAFKDALAPKTDKRVYSSEDKFAQLFAVKEMLRQAGIVNPDALPEFQNEFYSKDPRTDTLISLDIETKGTEDGVLTGVYSIQITTYNNGQRKTVVYMNKNNTLVDNKTTDVADKADVLTEEQVKQVLNEIEQYQNNGYKLLTHNGNKFDLSNLNLFGADPKQLFRIATRSIDILENIRFDAGRERVGGSGLKNLAEHNLPVYERLAYGGRIKFTNGYVQELQSDGSWAEIKIDQAKINKMFDDANTSGDWTTFNAYSENDTELTLDLYLHLASSNQTNLKLVYKNNTSYVMVNKPRSNLFLSFSEVNPGSRTFADSMTPILTINPDLNQTAKRMGYTEAMQINLDQVIDIVQGWLLEAWAADPDNKTTLDILTEGLEEQSSVKNKLHALAILKAKKFNQAIKPLAKKYFLQYGYVDRLNTVEDPKTGRLIINPDIYASNWETVDAFEDSTKLFISVEGTTEQQKEMMYEKQVVLYFIENLEESQRLKSIIETIPSRFNVRKQYENENLVAYFSEVLPIILSKYTKSNKISDFGNGTIDWHTAYDVGNAIADVLTNKQDGVTLVDNFVLEGGNVDNVAELNGTFAAWKGRQKNFIIPDKSRINFASPFGIAHEALIYDNYRLVNRIRWTLNQQWTDDQVSSILDWAQTPETLDPTQVISFFAKAAKPTIFPDIRSRSAFDLVPDLEERQRMAYEFVFQMPRLLASFNHDCEYRSLKYPTKFLGKGAPVYYASDWMSAGAPTAATVAAGAIDQIAWMLTFNIDSPEAQEELMRSIEAGVTLLRSNPNLMENSNKSDYSYHGLHIMLAAIKFYTPSGWGDYLKLLEDLKVAEISESGDLIITEETLKKELDPRFKAIDAVVEELGKIKLGTSSEKTKYSLNPSEVKLLEEVVSFFDLNKDGGKEFLKGAVTPRFYQAGAAGIFNGLMKRIEDNNLPLTVNHARVLTKVLLRENMNSHMALLDQAINLSKQDIKEVKNIFRKFSKTLSSANFKAEIDTMKQQNWYGEMDFSQRADQIRNYFNRYINLLANKLVSSRLSTTEREKAVEAKTEELRKLYHSRINEAIRVFHGIDLSQMSPEERIIHQEQVGRILSGGKKGYETHLTLWALNKRAATGYTLLDDNLEAHRRITGTHIDSDDYNGWLNRTIHHTYGAEAASGRNHMYGGYGYGPESSKLGQVRVQEGSEQNLLGIWDIDDTNTIESEFNRAFATQILLDLLPYYRPPANLGYTAESESEEQYFETMEKRSVLERNAVRQAEMLDDLDKTKTIAGYSVRDLIQKQTTVAGRPIERMRYRRLASSMISENNIINLDTSVDGIGSTRAMVADLDFTQRGIYSLIEMQNRINYENTREGQLLERVQQAKTQKPRDINSIIPLESRGYEKPTTKDALPVIPLQTGNTLSSIITGPTSEIEQMAIRRRNQLQIFAISNGLEELLNDKRYDLLYFISEGRRRALKPAIQLLESSTQNSQNTYFTAKAKFFDGMFKMIGLTARQYNPDKVYSVIELNPETSEIKFTSDFIQKLKNQNPEGLSYLHLLYHLSHVYDRLLGIRVGLVSDPGIIVRGEKGLIKSETRSVPLGDFNFEVSNLYQKILASDVMAREATAYLKATDPDLYDSTPKDINGFVIVEALPLDNLRLHQIITKVTAEKANELAKEWMQSNLVMGVPYSDISIYPTETVSPATGPLMIENTKVGTTHTFTSVNNNDTLWAFTEEMIVLMLNNLSNNPLFTSFELAYQTKKDIGSGNTITDQLLQEEQRNLFNYMGQFVEDEHASIVWLHMNDPSQDIRETLFTIKNYKVKDQQGNPTTILDAPKYLTETLNLTVNDRSLPISLESAIYVTDIMKSIKRAETLGLYKEAEQLKKFLEINLIEAEIKPEVDANRLVTIGSDTLLRTVSTLYNLGTNVNKLTRQQVMNFVQPNLTTENQKKMFGRALEITKIMQKIDNTNLEENQVYYYVASGLLDKQNEFSEDIKNDQGFISTVIDSVGVSLTNKERTRAVRSIQNAVDNYLADPGHTVNTATSFNPRTDIAQFADPEKFIDAFGETGRGIVDFLEGQVQLGNMTSRTRDLKLILIGSLAMQNPNFLADLQLESVELEGDSYARAAKKNGKYTIGLNIKAMRVTPENEVLLKFAEELVHIARIKYLKSNSAEFETLKGVFRSANAKGMIREMLIAMNMSKPYDAIEEDVNYAMKHEEEFIAHFGAVILLQETIYDPSVVNELEAKYEAVHQLSNWWRKAFNRIKQFAKHALKNLTQLKYNPYYKDNFQLAYNAIQGIIGNGLKDKVDVGNSDMEFNARKTITTTETHLSPEVKNQVREAALKIENIQRMLQSNTVTLTPEQRSGLETEQRAIEGRLQDASFNPRSVMGIKESDVQRGLAHLRRDKFGRIILRQQVDFTTRALIAEGLNNYHKKRGSRVDNKDTIGGLLRIWEGDRQFIDRFILPWIEGFNQNGLTYNSPEALAVMISDMLDDTTVNTQSSYRSNKNTGTFIYNKELLKSYLADLILHSTIVSQEFNDPEVREQIMMDLVRKMLGLPLFSTEPKVLQAVETLYKPMKVWNTRLRAEIFKSKIKENVDFLDPIGVKHKIARELSREQMDQGFRAVVNMMRDKYRIQLEDNQLGGIINPYILFMGNLLPDPNVPVASQAEFRESFIRFAKEPSATALTANEAIIKHLVNVALDKKLLSDQTIDPNRTMSMTKAFVANNPSNLEQHMKEAITDLIYRTRENDQSFTSELVTLNETETYLIFNQYVNTVNDSEVSQINGTKLRLIRQNIDAFGYYQGKSKYLPDDTGLASPMDALAFEYFGRLGASAYLFDTRTPMLTYQDIFLSDKTYDPDDVEIAKKIFEKDVPSIQHSLLKGIGYDAVQRIVVHDMLGIPGAYFTIGQVIDMVEGLVTQQIKGSEDKQLLNLDGHLDDQRAHTIERSLERLRLANQEARETLGYRDSGNPLLDTVVRLGRPMAMWAHGTNIPPATAIVEGGMGAIGSTIRGYNPVSFIWDATIQNTVMAFRSLGDIVTIQDGRLKFFDVSPNRVSGIAENSLWLMEEMFSPMLPGRLVGDTFTNDIIEQLSAWERFNITFGRMQSSTMKALRVAGETQARRRVVDEIRSKHLYTLRDSVRKIMKDVQNPSNETLRIILRDAESRVDQEILLVYIRSGLFEDGVIETLEYILSVAPSFRNDLSIMEMRNQEYELGQTNGVSFNKTVVNSERIAQARGVIIKLMKRHAELYMTAPHALDGTANSVAMNIIITFYKSYPTLFMSQFIMRRGSTTPAMRFAFELLVYGMLDVTYNLFLALKSGYYRWEKIKRALAAKDVNWTEVTKLILRFPVFSGNLLGLVTNLVGNLALDSGNKNTIFNSVAESAMGQNVRSVYKALQSYVLYAMGEVGPSHPLFNTYKALSPMLGGVSGGLVKMLIMQAFGDLNSTGRSSSSRSPSSFVMDKADSISHQNIREQAVRAIFRDAEYIPYSQPNARNVFGSKRWINLSKGIQTDIGQATKPVKQQVEEYQENTEWIDKYFPMPNISKPKEKSVEDQARNPIKPPEDLLE
jgi:hypothetical protein